MSEFENFDSYNPADLAEEIASKYYFYTSREGILQGITKMGENRQFQEENLALLRALYPDQWVAISDGQVIGPFEDFEAIWPSLDEKILTQDQLL